MECRSLLLSAMLLATSAVASAQANYGLGKPATQDDIKAWDLDIGDNGKGLPAGSGNAVEGAKVYAQKCVMCHGQDGRGGQAPNLVRKSPSDPPAGKPYIFATRVPFAPVLWDYIRRAMPLMVAPGSLKPDEVYSVTAYLLYKNSVIDETEVLDAQTLPKVKMPNQDGFIPLTTTASNPKVSKQPATTPKTAATN